MVTRGDYRYSVEVYTEDIVVLHCLRAVAQYAQKSGKKFVAWAGTKERDWKRDGCVKFHFSDPRYREDFKKQADRVLQGRFTLGCDKDKDPPLPKARKREPEVPDI